MFGTYDHRLSLSNKNMIQITHTQLTDTRPKTTHITSTLARNFPLHKSAYYKSYKYNVLSNAGRVPARPGLVSRGGTNIQPNFRNLNIKESQVSFPLWSKPFRPRQSTANKKLINTSPNHFVIHTKTSETPPPSRPRPRPTDQDLPPIVDNKRNSPNNRYRGSREHEKGAAPGATQQDEAPPIRVTFNYHNRRGSDTNSTDTVDSVNLTLQKYSDFLKRIGHMDLTHNSYVKVENWLAGLDRDGTWPVQWFATKR